MSTVPPHLRQLLDNLTYEEGRKLAEVGVPMNTIIAFSRRWEVDVLPDLLEDLDEVVAELVECIAAGFDARAEAAKTADRGHRDVDVVLAHQSAARFVREHAGNRFPSSQGAIARPGGTPEEADGSCPSCGRPAYPAGRAWPEGYERLVLGQRPATSPTGDPTR
jgi:hypothetical protein